MPFSPLPDLLLNKLRQLAEIDASLVLDLGCGDGSLGRICGDLGVDVFGLDSTGPTLGSAARIVGDALQPPLLPGGVDLVLAGNLFRHLLVRDPRSSFLRTWGDLLRPGGWLFLLEDERSSRPAAAVNYAELQDFLVTLTQGRRGKLVRLADFQTHVSSVAIPGHWKSGLKKNDWPADPETVMQMLRGHGQAPVGEASRLIDSIGQHGLAYGDYWWACWEKT